MQLNAYLARIGYRGPLDPDLATLQALHRAHLLAIPYENLDIHLGQPLSLDVAQIYDKLVARRRGGWCFEMNGLFAWALREIGFEVTLLRASVGRQAADAPETGGHLVLLVNLEEPYLADVGFGPGFLEPLALREGKITQGFLDFALEQIDGRWWFCNAQGAGPGFDFTLQPRTLGSFGERCRWLQSDPASGFVRNTVCHRRTPDAIHSLRGAVLRRIDASGVTERTIESLAVYKQTLRNVFELQVEGVDVLWTKVWASHVAWVANQQDTSAE